MKFFLLSALLLGCQTLPKKQESIVLPATAEAMFATCGGRDGALSLQFFLEGSLRGSGDFEWVSEVGKGWRGQLVNPLGRSLLNLGFDEPARRMTSTGLLAGQLPEFIVEEGILHAGGYYTGLRPEEMPCFLSMKLPRAWLANILTFKKTEVGLEFVFADGKRVIRTSVEGGGRDTLTKTCTSIEWRVYLGLASRRINICYRVGGSRVGSIEGVEDFLMKWTDLDG